MITQCKINYIKNFIFLFTMIYLSEGTQSGKGSPPV